MRSFSISTSKREEMVEITDEVQTVVRDSDTEEGICVVFTEHTTCGMTINENADPDVKSDMLGFLKKLIPQDYADFKHAEENSDAHIKSSIMGSSVTVPFSTGKLMLGRWQGIYLCEFDGPRERRIRVVLR